MIDYALVLLFFIYYHQQEMSYGVSNGHVTDDVT